MSTKIKKIVSLILSLTLMFSLCVPAYAANESNTLGVTFEVTLDNPTLTQSTSDQTVVMTLKTSQGVAVDGFSGKIVVDSPITIAEISTADESIPVDAAASNIATGAFYGTTTDYENATDVTEFIKVTLTVPANTTGTYNVGVQELDFSSDYGTTWESTATATTTLTIEEATVANGYTAGISTTDSEVAVDDTVSVAVSVSHSEDTTFAAGEVILSYDNTKLAFNESSSALGTATVRDNSGTLTLEDYGTSKNFGSAYTVVFDAIADGAATVTLDSAAFINKENAVKSDLVAATLSPAAINVTVNKKTFAVTLPDIFTGNSVATDGESYTFSVTDGDNYNYDSVTATVDGAEATVIDNGNGTYTIENVTGAVVITGIRTEKTYTVTFTGDGADNITDKTETATYNTDFTFTMPTEAGFSFALTKVTIGGQEYTGYTIIDSVVTIPGTAITGDILIDISETDTEAVVTVEGTGAGAAAGYETSANMGESYVLTITPEAGYTYTVTATMGGIEATLIENENTYTIEEVTGDIVFTVTRTVIVDGVTVNEYLTVDGSKMWLIKNTATLADGKVSTYNGNTMFWSDDYNAYCYLVVAETLDSDTAKAAVGITDGTAEELVYDMDINKTGKVDAADAQRVYNMYNAYYSNFTADATMAKFLESDINVDGIVNVEDATAIINTLLG